MRFAGLLLALLALAVHAEAPPGGTTPQERFNAGKSFATGTTDSSLQRATEDGDDSPGYTTDPPQSSITNSVTSLVAPAQTRINECKTAYDPNNKAEKAECEGLKYLDQERTKVPVSSTDPMFAGAKATASDPAAALASYGYNSSTGGNDCTTVTESVGDTRRTETCYVSKEVTNEECPVGRQVETDWNANYQCDVVTPKTTYETCAKKWDMTCTGGGDGCGSGGVIPGTTSGDMTIAAGGNGAGDYQITFGTIADNYWPSNTYDRQMTFEVADKAKITKFVLSNAWYDDWLWVKVNGTTVYLGPLVAQHGGDQIYRRYLGRGQYQVACRSWQPNYNCGPPELKTGWDISMDVDVLPYIVNGTNTVWMRTIVAGYGEGAIRFKTRALCPPSCTKTLTNGCATQEAATPPAAP